MKEKSGVKLLKNELNNFFSLLSILDGGVVHLITWLGNTHVSHNAGSTTVATQTSSSAPGSSQRLTIPLQGGGLLFMESATEVTGAEDKVERFL